MRSRVPIFRDHGAVHQADTCAPLTEGVRLGTVRLEALVRGQYPGRPLPSAALPGVKSVGFWDASTPQAWGLDWHRNEGLELTFLECGRLHYTLDGRTHDLRHDDLTIARPWQPHRVGAPHVRASRLHWLILDLGVRRPNQPWHWPEWIVLTSEDRERLTTFLRQNEQPVWHATSDIRTCWRRIARAVADDRRGSRISHLATYINDLFLLVLEMFDGRDVPLDARLSSSHRTVRMLLDEIASGPEHLAHPWDVRSMAKACGLGVTHFTALCRDIAGVPPIQFLTRARVEAARRMLAERPRASVTEVAFTCGFNSSQYFATVLRRMTGSSPRELRSADSAQNRPVGATRTPRAG